MADPNFGGTSSSHWENENTYVGYYECESPRYPCPQESQFPGWKKISEQYVGVGNYGGCPNCAMTRIYWGRINIPPGTPPVVGPISYSYEIIMKDGTIGIEGNPGVSGNYGNKIAVRKDPLTGIFVRADQTGNSAPPQVVTGCTEGTTRTVICPNNGKLITQTCTGKAWVTVKADETKCLSDGGIGLSNTIIILIIVILIFYMITRK